MSDDDNGHDHGAGGAGHGGSGGGRPLDRDGDGVGVGDVVGAAGGALLSVGGAVTGAVGGTARRALRRSRRVSDVMIFGASSGRHAPGTAPGTLVVDEYAHPTELSVLGWHPDGMDDIDNATLEDVDRVRGGHEVTWVNVEGLADLDVIRGLGERFDIHPLVLEDVVSVHSRGKIERYDDSLFVILRMATMHGQESRTEQVGIFFGQGFLVTFQEGLEGDCFEPVRRRIRAGGDELRKNGADFLAYALMDAVVDNYFPVLEAYGERLEDLETLLLLDPSQRAMGEIHSIKRDLLGLRRAIWPQREVLNTLAREDSALIAANTRTYLMDTYDHCIQIIDLLETYRELASGLVDLYLSSVSNRMNEVMKVLTVIATLFIPLTFISGLYGMNFKTEHAANMPELSWSYGYEYALGLMATVAIGLLLFFRRKGWIGGEDAAHARRIAKAREHIDGR